MALFAIPLTLANASGITPVSKHRTDGGFNLHNGGSHTSDAPEWFGPGVIKQFFPLASDGSGNAYLYVEQLNGTLYLMYDYLGGNASSGGTFDVFFQDPPESTDYGVHISGSSFQAYEKPFGPASPTHPDGSFDFSGAPWTPLTSADLALARFATAIGFGPSPNLATDHLMAEFELTINSGGSQSPNGIYDPAPAFWSASCTSCSSVIGTDAGDPPISSAIFQLNPDGSTTVTPVLSPNGGPVQQVAEMPEPASIFLLAPALMLFVRKRRAV